MTYTGHCDCTSSSNRCDLNSCDRGCSDCWIARLGHPMRVMFPSRGDGQCTGSVFGKVSRHAWIDFKGLHLRCLGPKTKIFRTVLCRSRLSSEGGYDRAMMIAETLLESPGLLYRLCQSRQHQ